MTRKRIINPLISDPGSRNNIQNKYELLSDLINHIPDVIYFKDKKGKLLLVNEAHAKGLGLKPKQVIGKTDFDIFPKDRAKKMAEDDKFVIRTGNPIIDKIERATRPDGIDNYVSTTKIPRFDKEGKIIGLMGITRDITHRMQLDYLKNEKGMLEKKLEIEKDLNKLKSDFVSIVSHELRTPLSIIKEIILLLHDEITGPLNEKQKELLYKARNNTERLRKIIEDLLDISRIEKGTLRVNFSLVNFNDLLLQSYQDFLNLAAQKQIRVSFDLPKKQINIFIDPERIYQCISNLLSNAIKFTQENGHIKIEVKILEDKIRIGVIDDGIGISKDDIPKLFNKFVQVSKNIAQQIKGLGLGLSITKELVERHGGEIWCESRPGIGSKFFFTLSGIYTTAEISPKVKEKINAVIQSGEKAYLVNLNIINFRKFKNRVKTEPKRLFRDLDILLLDVIKKSAGAHAAAEVILKDYREGTFGLVYTTKNEKQVNQLCESLKSRIKDYFSRNKVENVFINIGVISYPAENQPHSQEKVAANIMIKKILIGSELRRAKRINYKAEIEILSEKKPELTQAIDISRGGMCIETQSRLDTDSSISMNFELINKQRLKLNGKVRWIKNSDEHKNRFKTGIEFVGMNPEIKNRLLAFIKTIQKQNRS
ncbi:MAG: PAS domain S-box protein [Candidatus Omnitrophota bacterium]|jgi:PAS domain S-box-containing protein|nr:MAG: PAS domain S-box protein [Candidatus Omnitrophota bacterium]